MANPIYLLQLTDWHLFDKKILESEKPDPVQADYLKKQARYLEKKEKLKELETKKNNLIKNMQFFLKEKGRAHLDVICVTGDMMNQNGDNKKGESITDYSFAAKMVNDVADTLLDKGDKRRLYSTPGNHDLSIKSVNDIVSNEFCTKVVLDDPRIPNYLIVDALNEDLEKCYYKYVTFLKEINATNKESPFSGFNEIKFSHSSLFVSWFNSSWLSMGKYYYGKIKSDEGCKIYDADYENLSLGSNINIHVHEAFQKFKKENANVPYFSFSMSHHFPRLLNWFDKYDVESNFDILKKKKFESTELRKETKENLEKAEYKIKIRHESMYSQFKKYDLVLNGHTHGKLFDKPFLTSEGLNTIESTILKKDFFIYEVDIIRKYIIVYYIPFEEINHEDSHEFEIYKIITFDDVEYAKKMKSNYSKQDLFDDLLYNDKLNFEDDKNMSINNLINSININEMTKNQLITAIDNYKLDKSVLKDDPLILKRIKGEILGLKTKLS